MSVGRIEIRTGAEPLNSSVAGPRPHTPTMRTAVHASNAAPGPSAGLGADLLRRVHLYSLLLTLLFAGLIAVRLDREWALGFLCSGLWSTANFWTLERLLRAAVRPSGRDRRVIVLAGLVKIPVLYALLVLMLLKGGWPALSTLAGLSVPLLVTVLKILGRLVAPGGQRALHSPAESDR